MKSLIERRRPTGPPAPTPGLAPHLTPQMEATGKVQLEGMSCGKRGSLTWVLGTGRGDEGRLEGRGARQ